MTNEEFNERVADRCRGGRCSIKRIEGDKTVESVLLGWTRWARNLDIDEKWGGFDGLINLAIRYMEELPLTKREQELITEFKSLSCKNWAKFGKISDQRSTAMAREWYR